MINFIYVTHRLNLSNLHRVFEGLNNLNQLEDEKEYFVNKFQLKLILVLKTQ